MNKNNIKLANRPQNKNFGIRAGKAYGKQIHEEYKTKYYISPLKCLQCGNIISYEKRHTGGEHGFAKFCNHSCAASYTNKHRSKDFWTEEKRLNQSLKMKKLYPNNLLFCRVYFKKCLTCNNFFIMKRKNNKKKIYCSKICDPEFYTRNGYRRQCKFKLNNKDHKELFNVTLIKKYGWYVPTNNKTNKPPNINGVCWDHLFRIADGYKLKIPSNIMNHPANAELVPWRVNISRQKSLITYEELLNRIKLWDSGNRNLQIFFQEN